MPRIKISEYRAKVVLYNAFGKKYSGATINLNEDLSTQIAGLSFEHYVVKVDQAVKKRNKLGLVFVKHSKKQTLIDLQLLKKKGYSFALVESFVGHLPEDEKYISLSRSAGGIELMYSERGGVDIESNQASLQTSLLDHFKFRPKDNTTNLQNSILAKLYAIFAEYHMTYLEINPALIENEVLLPLDAAVEVDSSARFFIRGGWDRADLRNPTRLTPVEKAVEELADKSPASFSLKVLNPNGSIFLLLSGGGASIVVADEFASHGFYNEIANYGEYSGGPNADETFIYSRQLLSLLVNSKSKKKILFIGGGTANFTDIAKTFKGVIAAMSEIKNELVKQKVTVYVRRGGPNQQQGLNAIAKFLDDAKLRNKVCGPDVPIEKLVKDAAKGLK